MNKEIKRRTAVIGVFPNPAALLRLAGAVLVEQHDEWEARDRRNLSEASMAELKAMNKGFPYSAAATNLRSKARPSQPG